MKRERGDGAEYAAGGGSGLSELSRTGRYATAETTTSLIYSVRERRTDKQTETGIQYISSPILGKPKEADSKKLERHEQPVVDVARYPSRTINDFPLTRPRAPDGRRR
ncbi:hypothetical protein EVAR_93831_1 [Eumeta japonica]|uniref:Uncharacterized protein n=1 Tax=Eumeta variegata TaxID=151549 RepID=A0A4C1TWM0_EUMVA|nr:hypothetical protein EVAR_93831_1 [Eumeta japonica]